MVFKLTKFMVRTMFKSDMKGVNMKLEILERLKERFKEKMIFTMPDEVDPDEIVVELTSNSTSSTALAVIWRSTPHKHYVTVETYEVRSGTLVVHVDDVTHEMNAGDSFTIQPEEVHWAECHDEEGSEVLVTATPPWSQEDHILV